MKTKCYRNQAKISLDLIFKHVRSNETHSRDGDNNNANDKRRSVFRKVSSEKSQHGSYERYAEYFRITFLFAILEEWRIWRMG